MSTQPLATWQPFRAYAPPLSLDAVAAAYAYMKPGVRSPATDKRVRTTLGNWARYLGRRPTIEDLDPEAINAWLARRRREPVQGGWVRRRYRSASPLTLLRDLGRVLTLWRWAAEHGLCEPPPKDFRNPPRRPKAPQPWWRRLAQRRSI